MSDRTPWDGRPFYCQTCGLGLGEFAACELVDCRLESVDAAARRQAEATDVVEVPDDQGHTYRVTLVGPREGRRLATIERKTWYGVAAALLPSAAKAKRLVKAALAQLEARPQ